MAATPWQWVYYIPDACVCEMGDINVGIGWPGAEPVSRAVLQAEPSALQGQPCERTATSSSVTGANSGHLIPASLSHPTYNNPGGGGGAQWTPGLVAAPRWRRVTEPSAGCGAAHAAAPRGQTLAPVRVGGLLAAHRACGLWTAALRPSFLFYGTDILAGCYVTARGRTRAASFSVAPEFQNQAKSLFTQGRRKA